MRTFETQSIAKAIALIVVQLFVSAFIIWLLNSWMGLVSAILMNIVVGLVVFIINQKESEPTIIFKIHPWMLTVLDIVFLIIPSILMLASVFRITPSVPISITTLLVTSYIPGRSLIRLTGIGHSFSSLENLLIGFLTSYAFTGILWAFLLFIPSEQRAVPFLSVCSILALLACFKKAIKRREVYPSFHHRYEILALLACLGFSLFSYILIYPGFVLIPTTDISRHYASSIILGRTPGLYNDYNYLLAHLHQSAFLIISNSNLVISQVTLLAINLLCPISFYIAATRFLRHYDSRFPALATIIWTFFTNALGGFSWIVLAGLKIFLPNATQSYLLDITSYLTYNGTKYGILNLWYVPTVTAVTLFLFLFAMLSNRALNRRSFIFIFALGFTSMFLTHITEAILFALILIPLGLVIAKREYRIEESIISASIGLSIVFGVYWYLSLILVRFSFNISLMLAMSGLLGMLIIVGIYQRYTSRTVFHQISEERFEISKWQRFAKIASPSIVLIYFVAVFSWLTLVETFNTAQVVTIGVVPWFLYPMLLGVSGFLAAFAIPEITKERGLWRVYVVILITLVVCLFGGRAVSFININLFEIGFWEKRFIAFIKMPLALIAPVFTISIVHRIKRSRKGNFTREFLCIATVGIIVLSGMTTSMLNIQYWNSVVSDPQNMVSAEEMAAIEQLKSILENDNRAWALALSPKSNAIVTLAAPPDQLGLQRILTSATTPEMGLRQLYRHSAYSHPYIYLADRDVEVLNTQPNSYLTEFLKWQPVIFNNSAASILNVTKMSVPQEDAAAALILPQDGFLDSHLRYAGYQMLSGAFANYTAAYDTDDTIFDYNTLILGFDHLGMEQITDTFESDFSAGIEDWQILDGDWDVHDGVLISTSSDDSTIGKILCDVSLSEFNASFTANPIKLNSSLHSYIGLIYSYINPKNFNLIEILFYKDGFIHILGNYVDDDEWTDDDHVPSWPGHNSSIGWKLGTNYNFDFIAQNDSIKILINGNSILTLDGVIPTGKIGLFQARTEEAHFSNFEVSGIRKLEFRPVEDYIEFASNGGTLIVLNTNGQHNFSKRFFETTNNTLYSEFIWGESDQIDLPVQIEVQAVSPKNNTNVIASYITSSGSEIPYTIEEQIGTGRIICINLYPVLRYYESEPTRYPPPEVLNNLLHFIDLPRMAEHVVRSDAYVRSIHLENATISSDVILFPLDTQFESISVFSGFDQITHQNVTEIHMINYESLLVESSYIDIDAGSGFYAACKLNSTFSMMFASPNASVHLETSDGIFVYEGISRLEIKSNSILELLIRNPIVQAESGIFEELYTYNDLKWSTGAYGQDLQVYEGVSFYISVSDTFTILRSMTISGRFSLEPPLAEYDEMSTLPVGLVWGIVLLPVFLIVLVVVPRKQRPVI